MRVLKKHGPRRPQRWILTLGITVTLAGTHAPVWAGQDPSCYEPLRRGWNLVSTPQPHAVDFEALIWPDRPTDSASTEVAWVHSTSPASIETKCRNTVSDHSALRPGWNLVHMTFASRFEHPDVVSVVVWDPVGQVYHPLSRGAHLTPGSMYWVKLRGPRDAVIDRRIAHPFWSPPSTPEGVGAVDTGSMLHLQWQAPRRFADRRPIPDGLPVGARVYRNGVRIAEVAVSSFEEQRPSEATTYYVTTIVKAPDGMVWESEHSALIELDPLRKSPMPTAGSFELAYEAARQDGPLALPRVVLSRHQDTVFAHAVYLKRGLKDIPDQIRYLRSNKAGKKGSWSPPTTLVTLKGNSQVNSLALAARNQGLAVAWTTIEHGLESTTPSGRGGVHVLEDQTGGTGWIERKRTKPIEVRASSSWTRDVSLAYDHFGILHLVWAEKNKAYYLKNLEGAPSNIFDPTYEAPAAEQIHYMVQYEAHEDGVCDCPSCWCPESHPLNDGTAPAGTTPGASSTWTENNVVRSPSLHVDHDHIVVVGRLTRRWDNRPVENPLWTQMLADPVYSETIVQRRFPTRLLVGWKQAWKRAYEPGDETKYGSLGHRFQYLYEGTWHEEDLIQVATRPLVPQTPQPEGEKSSQSWRIRTVDVLSDPGLDAGVSHPQVKSTPQGRLYVAYERGPSKDPNATPGNPLVLSYSDDRGQSWSAPKSIGFGYTPQLGVSSGLVQVVSYRPGAIQTVRSENGDVFVQEDLNQGPVKPIHWKTHGPGADVLWGVPTLAAHENLFVAAWIQEGQHPSDPEGLALARATSLSPEAVRARIDLSALGPVVSGQAAAFQVRLENQYHMATPGDLGSFDLQLENPSSVRSLVSFRPGDAGSNGKEKDHGEPPSGVAPLTQAHPPHATSVLEGPSSGTAIVWASLDALDTDFSLLVSTPAAMSTEPLEIRSTAAGMAGNYEQAIALRDALYRADIGAQQEFQDDSSNNDTQPLAAFDRVWVYTQGIALAQAARQGNFEKAKAMADWLCARAVWDHAASQPTILGWHFSHNTRGDDWRDIRLVTGASAWAIHGLGVFLSSSGQKAENANRHLECYRASLRGLKTYALGTGLVGAGMTVVELAEAQNGRAYYQALDDLGYEEEPQWIKTEHVVTEHNLDVLSVLNHALRHASDFGLDETAIRAWRNRLRASIFDLLYDEDVGRMITGGDFDAQGRFYASAFSAVDNCSWLVLSVDFPTLNESQTGKLAACLHHTVDAFVKDLPFGDAPQDRRYRGAHYFPRDFKDPYIDLSPEDQEKQPKSYHLEATAGVILGLWRFAEESGHREAAYFQQFGDSLWHSMQDFVAEHGFPYSSQRIQNLSTLLQSSTAAIWFLDVADHTLDRQKTSDRPLKSYARKVTYTRTEPTTGLGAEAQDAYLSLRPISTAEVMESIKRSKALLSEIPHSDNPEIANPGIWRPEMPNNFFQPGLHNDGSIDADWYDNDIDLPEAWSLVSGPGSVVVAVLDSKFSNSRRFNLWTNSGEIAGDGLDNDGNGFIDDVHGWDTFDGDGDPFDGVFGHGTKVSMFLAGRPLFPEIVGTAPGAPVMIVRTRSFSYAPVETQLKAYERFVTGADSDIRGMDYVIEMKRRFDQGQGGADVRVISTSVLVRSYLYAVQLTTTLFGPLMPSLFVYRVLHNYQTAIARAEAAGILVVAAADNQGGVLSIPAELTADNLVGVVGTNVRDELAQDSDSGETLELAAPRFLHHPYGFARDVGNSNATPVVSGAALLAWQVAPEATPKQIKQALLDGADPVEGLKGKTTNGGRLNVFRTLQHLRLAQFTEVPSRPGARASSIEDKIETPNAKVRYVLRLPPGEALRVSVEPLRTDALSKRILHPRVMLVPPQGDPLVAETDTLGATLNLGPVYTAADSDEQAYSIIISGDEETIGPFRLRVLLSETPIRYDPPKPLSLELQALSSIAWTNLGVAHQALPRLLELIANLSAQEGDAPSLEDAFLAIYAGLWFGQRFPEHPSREATQTAFLELMASWVPRVTGRLEDTRAPSPEAPYRSLNTSALVYLSFALDLALETFDEEQTPLKERWSMDRDQLRHTLLDMRWDDQTGLPLTDLSTQKEQMQDSEIKDAVLYGLFLLREGHITRAKTLLASVVDLDRNRRWPPPTNVSSGGLGSKAGLILLWRAAGAFDPRFEELALALSTKEGALETEPGVEHAVASIAHQPAGVFGVHVGPSLWTLHSGGTYANEISDPLAENAFLVGLPEWKGKVSWAQVEKRLQLRFVEALFSLLASGPKTYEFDYWVRRLHEIRFLKPLVEDRMAASHWLEIYESRSHVDGMEETVSFLLTLCAQGEGRDWSDSGAQRLLGIPCGVAIRAFKERLAERLGDTDGKVAALMDQEDAAWSFSRFARSLLDELPLPSEHPDHDSAAVFGNVDLTIDSQDAQSVANTLSFLDAQYALEQTNEGDPGMDGVSLDANAAEVRRTLRARFVNALQKGIREAAGRGTLVYHFWGVDLLESQNPGSPLYWDRKSIELRTVLEASATVEWRFRDVVTDSFNPVLSPSRINNVLWLRRLINEKAQGDLPYVALALGKSPGAPHRWMLSGHLPSQDFEALGALLLSAEERNNWRARFVFPSEPSTQRSR